MRWRLIEKVMISGASPVVQSGPGLAAIPCLKSRLFRFLRIHFVPAACEDAPTSWHPYFDGCCLWSDGCQITTIDNISSMSR